MRFDLDSVYNLSSVRSLPMSSRPSIALSAHDAAASSLGALPAVPARVDQTYRALLDAIVSGELRPGERHTQEGLAQQLGVSRQPILQALLLLRRQGLIKDEPGRYGIEVIPLTRHFVGQLYAVRGALDALAARSAARRPPAALLSQGRQLIAAGRAAARHGELGLLVDADIAFHRFVYAAADNALLGETAEVHWLHTRRTMATYLRAVDTLQNIWTEHEAILDAIAIGDAQAAERLAREHCEHSADLLLDALPATSVTDRSTQHQTENPQEPT
jgi:DNA-binding GntR family transcriptional regulator